MMEVSVWKSKTFERLKDTPAQRKFWEAAERASREVATWPAWKRLATPEFTGECPASETPPTTTEPTERE